MSKSAGFIQRKSKNQLTVCLKVLLPSVNTGREETAHGALQEPQRTRIPGDRLYFLAHHVMLSYMPKIICYIVVLKVLKLLQSY